jgi:hypothetical protein
VSGWRRSADRAGLQSNSLLSRNFTGNLAVFRPGETFSEREVAVPQPFLEQFPTQIIRELISKISEFFDGISELD